MKFARKMCLKILLKVSKNQGFTISLEDIGPLPPAVLGLTKK